MGIPEPEFTLTGFRILCLACNVAWWDTDSLEKEKALQKASYDHSVDKDHDDFLAAISFR